MIQLDFHIFQMGWFNHQLGNDGSSFFFLDCSFYFPDGCFRRVIDSMCDLFVSPVQAIDSEPLREASVWTQGEKGWEL